MTLAHRAQKLSSGGFSRSMTDTVYLNHRIDFQTPFASNGAMTVVDFAPFFLAICLSGSGFRQSHDRSFISIRG